MNYLKIPLLFSALSLSVSPHAVAQWMGTDEQPLEPAKAQVSYLGADVTKSTTPGGPSAVVRVYGEGYPTPPVYPVKPEQISALKLNTAQEAALKKELPDFIPWTLSDYGGSAKYFPFSKKQLPYAISWDYDGKNTPIRVITGHDEERNYLAIFKPEGNSYKVIKREAGFIQTTRIPETILPALRMIKRGTRVNFHNEENTPAHVLKHDAFAYFNIWVSTEIQSERYTQLGADSLIYYFHEGLFRVGHADVKDFSPRGGKPPKDKPVKELAPSPEITTALSKFNKDFKAWTSRDYPQNSAPGQYAIRQDLNGDGIEDMVIAGHDNDANLVMEVISGTDGYHVSPVGDSTPCYAKARERNSKLKFKPSHTISLYKKGTNYTSLATKATKNLWNYSDASIIGIRMLNTCIKRRTGPAEDFESDFEYANWTPWTDKNKETLYVYGEALDAIYCPGGIDHCGFELTPPAGDNGDRSK